MRLLLIEWIDSCSSGGWKGKEDINTEPSHCFSVGLAFKETEEAITLVLSGANDTREYADTMTIPVGSIKRIRELKVVK